MTKSFSDKHSLHTQCVLQYLLDVIRIEAPGFPTGITVCYTEHEVLCSD